MKLGLIRLAAGATFAGALLSASHARAQESGVTRITAAPIDASASACTAEERAAAGGVSVDAHMELGACYARAGRVASAYAAFGDAATLAQKVGDKRRREILAQREALEPHLSKLIIVLDAPAHAAGMQIARDGVAVDPTELGRWVPVDPGTHTVTVTAPARRPWEMTVRVAAEGGMETVTVPVLEGDSAAPTPIDATEREGRGQRTVGLVVGGAGLLMLGAGALFGLESQSKGSQAASHCNPAPDSRCDTVGVGLRSDQRTAATTATVAFIGGAVAVGVGAALWITAPRGGNGPRVGVTPAVGPQAQGVIVTGAF